MEDKVRIGLCGDVMLGRLVDQTLQFCEPKEIWGDLLPLFKSMDLTLVNLETTLTTSTTEVPKVFNFRADPARVQVLNEASIEVVNLANNHILDYAEQGLLETIQVLEQAHIAHVGAGANWEAAKKPVVFVKKGIRIGIIGYTDNEPTWKATANGPGTHYVSITPEGLEKVTNEIIAFRPQVDLLILTMHWGPNMVEEPPPFFQRFARAALDAGVDIFHGHSAHIFQGVEIHKGRLILYDTGDFVDDYRVDPILRNDRSFFFIVEWDKGKLGTVQLVPVRIDNCRVMKAIGEDRSATLRRMELLSKQYGTTCVEEKGILNVYGH